MPPQQALSSQAYTAAPNMLSLRWSILFGATVIRKDIWSRIPADVQTQLLDAAVAAGTKIRAATRRDDEAAIEAMRQRGMVVNLMPPEFEPEWRQFADDLYSLIRGKMIPADVFDLILQWVAEYRAGLQPSYPLTLPIGMRRATRLLMPASSVASTTSSMFLYAGPASSARPE
jgi:hypothetical protein